MVLVGLSMSVVYGSTNVEAGDAEGMRVFIALTEDSDGVVVKTVLSRSR